MGCQKSIAHNIIDKGADYILGLKENQKGLLEQIENLFNITAAASQGISRDIGHGRVEERKCTVIQDLTFLDGRQNWAGLKSIIKIESKRSFKNSQKTESTTRYYISSLTEGAKQVNDKIRSHWAIENSLHWVLDVTFDEDASRRRKGNSASNYNIITKIALSLIEQTDANMPRSQKRKRAAFDSDFREKILKL
jgi:predicted transposase YbfD/YdcC